MKEGFACQDCLDYDQGFGALIHPVPQGTIQRQGFIVMYELDFVVKSYESVKSGKHFDQARR